MKCIDLVFRDDGWHLSWVEVDDRGERQVGYTAQVPERRFIDALALALDDAAVSDGRSEIRVSRAAAQVASRELAKRGVA